MLSFVVCSVNESKLELMRKHLDLVLPDTEHELVCVRNPRSLAAGYNWGMAEAKGDRIVFCHDDIEFIAPSVGPTIERYFENFDGFGVAGTDRLAGASWTSAAPPHLFGQVMHKIENGYQVCIYGAPAPVVAGIQAMDGLLMAFRRELIEDVGWDEEIFDGFHFYDLDTSFRACNAGYKLAIACDLPLYHASGGTYDDQWQVYAHRFLRKHGGSLARKYPYRWNFATCEVRTKREALEIMTPAYWKGDLHTDT